MEMEELNAFIKSCESIMEYYLEQVNDTSKELSSEEYSKIMDAYNTIKAKKQEAIRQLLHNERFIEIYQTIEFSQKSDAKTDIKMM